jgi:hypothetical protein
VQFLFSDAEEVPSAPQDDVANVTVVHRAAADRRGDAQRVPADEEDEMAERFDILSALPEEVALRVLGGGELATRRAAHDEGGAGSWWTAWELRNVVGLVCRNWRRLALDAGLLASTLHRCAVPDAASPHTLSRATEATFTSAYSRPARCVL